MAKAKRIRQSSGAPQTGGAATLNKPKTVSAASDRINKANSGAPAKGAPAEKPSQLARLREKVPAPRANQNRRYPVKPWWQGPWGVASVAVTI
ncbi:MAG TPA: hypothetical protein VKQ36_13045, partial [Ktedonobacterales bacterium]|nr:hypothetical protein [Ktedonobacterales bacterium]